MFDFFMESTGRLLDATVEYYKQMKQVTWFLALPFITTAGRTGRGGTGSTVTINQSGRQKVESIPSISHSSSDIRLNIS